MPETPKSSFALQNSDFRVKFFFDQNLDFVLGTVTTTSANGNNGDCTDQEQKIRVLHEIITKFQVNQSDCNDGTNNGPGTKDRSETDRSGSRTRSNTTTNTTTPAGGATTNTTTSGGGVITNTTTSTPITTTCPPCPACPICPQLPDS